jgi:hypothetical protein
MLGRLVSSTGPDLTASPADPILLAAADAARAMSLMGGVRINLAISTGAAVLSLIR